MREDDQTTVASLKALVGAFASARGWDAAHNPKDLAIGLVTEASELLEIFRFRDARDVAALLADPAARRAVADELADALYCILRFAERSDFDLSRSLRDKLETTALKYPVGQ